MKRIKLIAVAILVICICIFLSGCGNKDKNKENTGNSSEVSNMAENTEKNQSGDENNNESDEKKQEEAKENSQKTEATKEDYKMKAYGMSDAVVKGLSLGMTRAEVEDMLGDADAENSYKEAKKDHTIVDLKYDSIHLTIGMEKIGSEENNEYVSIISYNGDDVVTRGLKVDSSYDDVINAFPDDSIRLNQTYGNEKIIVVGYPDESPSYVEGKSNAKLIFSLDKDSNKVKNISIAYGYDR